jgi:hypothetical protein
MPSALADLICVKGVSSACGFVINRLKVRCDGGNRILLLTKPRELRVVQVSSCPAAQDGLRQ